MAKVLISFLGVSLWDERTKIEERKYRKATYRFEDGDEIQSPFIAEALIEHYDIDKIIFIGTMHSMWEEIYCSFAEKNNCLDENVWAEIGEVCQSSNYATEIKPLPHQEELEKALGKETHVCLIKYGLDEKEIISNSETILGCEEWLNDKDELYVDITHAFRSLPIYLMNYLVYLQNVSPKQIEIKSINYGMLDVSKELDGITPVVELKSLMAVNDWITGAYNLETFGNAYKIAQLLGDSSIGNKLKSFSDEKNLNNISSVLMQIEELRRMRTTDLPKIAQKIIPTAIDNFVGKFKSTDYLSEKQFKLARWHFEHKAYGYSLVVLVEAVITYACEFKWPGKKDYVYEERELAKDVIRSGILDDPEAEDNKKLSRVFIKINDYRNMVSHDKYNNLDAKVIINELKKAFSELGNNIIRKKTEHRSVNKQ